MLQSKDFLFRASSMGDVMVGVAKGWGVEKSTTCQRKLVQMYRELAWNRKPNSENKYTKKGKLAENSGIDLYCMVKGKFYKKNEERLSNDFFTGECDIFDGEDVRHAEETIDIKCSWDAFTFPSLVDTSNKDYEYQGEVYMNLTGAKKHTVAYCLVNTPASQILDTKFYLAKKHGIIDTETDDYIEACRQLEIDSIFDMEAFEKEYPYFEHHIPKSEWKYDIPREERIHEIVTYENFDNLLAMKSRVLECRQWIDKYLLKH